MFGAKSVKNNGNGKNPRDSVQRFAYPDFIVLQQSVGAISDEEAERKLDQVWFRAYCLSPLERILSELFPAAFERKA
jgi:hypothetical protein